MLRYVECCCLLFTETSHLRGGSLCAWSENSRRTFAALYWSESYCGHPKACKYWVVQVLNVRQSFFWFDMIISYLLLLDSPLCHAKVMMSSDLSVLDLFRFISSDHFLLSPHEKRSLSTWSNQSCKTILIVKRRLGLPPLNSQISCIISEKKCYRNWLDPHF